MAKGKKVLLIVLSITGVLAIVTAICFYKVKTDHTKPKITITSPEVRIDISKKYDLLTDTNQRVASIRGKVSDNVKVKSLSYKLIRVDRFYWYKKTVMKEEQLPVKKQWEIKNIPISYLANPVEITATDWNHNKKTILVNVLNVDQQLKWQEEQAAVKEGVLLFSLEEANLLDDKVVDSDGTIAPIYKKYPIKGKNVKEAQRTYEIEKDNQFEELYREGKFKLGTCIYIPDGFDIDGYEAKLISRKELENTVVYKFEDMSYKPEQMFKKEWQIK